MICCSYLFSLIGQFIGCKTLQDKCCLILSTLLEAFQNNPTEDIIHVLGQQLQVYSHSFLLSVVLYVTCWTLNPALTLLICYCCVVPGLQIGCLLHSSWKQPRAPHHAVFKSYVFTSPTHCGCWSISLWLHQGVDLVTFPTEWIDLGATPCIFILAVWTTVICIFLFYFFFFFFFLEMM